MLWFLVGLIPMVYSMPGIGDNVMQRTDMVYIRAFTSEQDCLSAGRNNWGQIRQLHPQASYICVIGSRVP